MINSVRRSKTGALWAISDQESYISRKKRIMAWPDSYKVFFYQRAAYIVAKHHIYQKKQHPDPAIYFEI
jgi:hypothetical protein